MKKIVFLSGTRADFGKLKSLIKITQDSNMFEVHIFVTGMHMNSKYGKTVNEIVKSGFQNIYKYINHDDIDHMDRTLANTINGFSRFISEYGADLIVVHGDRVEALAGAIVGSLNNILVAHIEGGELSGTIDELIRHSVTKLSHVHFVSNNEAKRRLIQLGEIEDSVFVIGSPDLDIMLSDELPSLEFVKKYYDISFNEYSILMFHPVTTEYEYIEEYTSNVVDAVLKSEKNYIVIFPNNDLGSKEILKEYHRLENIDRVKIFPSLRFEYFLVLLKHSSFILGNSSAGIREAPFYNIPTIDIGTRQKNRAQFESIIHVGYETNEILDAINLAADLKVDNVLIKDFFGNGESSNLFFNVIKDSVWQISNQKQFMDIV